MPAQRFRYSRLCVVHYHLRPGGVRRIIELALPHLVRALGFEHVTILVGEARDADWEHALRRSLHPVPLEIVRARAVGYAAELKSAPANIRRDVARVLAEVVTDPARTLLWVHNPGLARNLILTDALRRFSRKVGAPMVFHHHDFWFENRWGRWPEVRKGGFRSEAAIAESMFAADAPVVQAAINRADASILERDLSPGAAWLPNLAARQRSVGPARRTAAARWMADRIGADVPFWIVPTRFLRRKNLAEAVLVARWLRPEAWLVTTAGVSSEDERSYARKLERAAQRGRWQVRFRVLDRDPRGAPEIGALLEAAEAIVLTSAQEGFGLPYIEAAAVRRPLIARRLPNVAPDLEAFGFRLPWIYDEIWVAPGLIDEEAERRRQEASWRLWLRDVPSALRPLAGRPMVLDRASGQPLPFSRLTLAGQLEVLALPVTSTWSRSAAFNPGLARWKRAIERGNFRVPAWPRQADAQIGGPAYAGRFREAVERIGPPARPAACRAALRDFLREKLGTPFLYPILFPEK